MDNCKKPEVMMGLYDATKGYIASQITEIENFWKQPDLRLAEKTAPLVNGIIKAGTALISAGTDIAQGNYKKAGVTLTGGPKEPPYDMRKAITSSAQLKAMGTDELITAIQKDHTFPASLNIKGHEITFIEAMQGKDFSAGFIKEMMVSAKKDPSLNVRVAALKEYAARVEAARPAPPPPPLVQPQDIIVSDTSPKVLPPQSAKVATAPSTPTQTSTFTSALTKPDASANVDYQSMSASQLVTVIREDSSMPEIAKVGTVDIRLSSALRDKDFRNTFVDELEKAQIKGVDVANQIAIVRAYDVALNVEQLSRNMAQTAKFSSPAPTMA